MPPEGESGPWGGGWKCRQAESPAVEKIIEDLDQLQSVEERGCDAFTIRTKKLHMQMQHTSHEMKINDEATLCEEITMGDNN